MYDPMLDDSPGCGIEYPSSYWADVSCALHLAPLRRVGLLSLW